jgi:hypothetical protein
MATTSKGQKWELQVKAGDAWVGHSAYRTKEQAKNAAEKAGLSLPNYQIIDLKPKKPAAPEPTFTGVVERATLEYRKPFDPYIGKYSPNSEYADACLDVALRLDDGRMAYFTPPAARRVITSAPGCAIVTFSKLDGEVGKWLKEEGTERVATPGKSNNNTLVPLVRVGDRITVTGRVKAEKVSKAGRPYITLNYVRRK